MAHLGEFRPDGRVQLSDLAIEAGDPARQGPDLPGQRRLKAPDGDAGAGRLDQGIDPVASEQAAAGTSDELDQRFVVGCGDRGGRRIGGQQREGGVRVQTAEQRRQLREREVERAVEAVERHIPVAHQFGPEPGQFAQAGQRRAKLGRSRRTAHREESRQRAGVDPVGLRLAALRAAELGRLIRVDEHHPVAVLRQELDEGQVVVAGRLQADQHVAGLRGEPLQERPESLEAVPADREGDPTDDAVSRRIVAGRLVAALADVDADGDSRHRLTPIPDAGDVRGCPRPPAKHARSGLTTSAAPHFSIRGRGGGCHPKNRRRPRASPFAH